MKIKIVLLAAFFIILANHPFVLPQENAGSSVDANQVVSTQSKVDSKASSSQDLSKISIDIKNMDILDVLKMLAMRANLNIVAGRNVTGKVTIFLKDADIMDALEIILASNDMAYEKRGNIINVMTSRDYEMVFGERYSDRRKLISIPLKFAKASNMAAILSQVKSNVGKIIGDDSSNTLIVLDVSERLDDIKKMATEMDRPLVTKVFDLNYAPSDKLLAQLQESVTKGVGNIRIDERTSKLVVVDLPEKMADIEKVIAEFDEKTRQVLIEAKIVQVTLSDDYKMGIDWEKLINSNLDIKGMFSVAARGGGAMVRGGQLILGSTTITNEGDYNLIINALKSIGDTRVLANPRITAINGQEAKILVGKKQPYTTSTVSQGQSTTQTADSVTFLDVGVKLYVTPKINKKGYVTMKIRPEVSSVVGNYPTSGNTTIPIVETSEAETSVMVKDGVTIIIGGLIKDEKTESVDKIPVLGDIPFIGSLFRNKSSELTRTELVIFLTPHIISGNNFYLDYPTKSNDRDVLKVKSDFEAQANGVRDPKNSVKQDAFDLIRLPNDRQQYYSCVRDAILASTNKSSALKGSVDIRFNILSDGSLNGEPVIISSSNKLLDEIILTAVKEASPYPVFPSDIKEDSITFRSTFSFE